MELGGGSDLGGRGVPKATFLKTPSLKERRGNHGVVEREEDAGNLSLGGAWTSRLLFAKEQNPQICMEGGTPKTPLPGLRLKTGL